LVSKQVLFQNPNGPSTVMDDISRFIQAASLGSNNNEQDILEDVTRKSKSLEASSLFISLKSLSPLLSINDEKTSIRDKNRILMMEMDSQYQLCIRSEESNAFCREWASKLYNSEKDPLVLRSTLEEEKFKIIQELNQLHRLIDQARTNNYALYRSYKYLQTNSNYDALMWMLYQDPTNDIHVVEILEVIENHIRKSREKR